MSELPKIGETISPETQAALDAIDRRQRVDPLVTALDECDRLRSALAASEARVRELERYSISHLKAWAIRSFDGTGYEMGAFLKVCEAYDNRTARPTGKDE